MNERKKLKYILYGIKRYSLYALIAAAALSVIASVYSLIKHSPVMKNIYTSFYYFGAFSLIFAVPQLYKRNEDPKLRRVRASNPIDGANIFKNPYVEEAMLESFEEFKGEGFWTGIFIVVFCLVLFLLGFLLESIYFYLGG
ncbi:hypothetical protein [Fonticella tunisiensis]|uniref:DUF3899 domain-containing protein n=1 Tax=Fonticella tunisiensis TaxID=1096341 RepID=A0A4R7KBS7_9CLOT|nr:hypothetical protein [Fonticella tunisiensis]TDT50550.1 hypothetical protein EDD71_12713 [Fonticella tunisiensis]